MEQVIATGMAPRLSGYVKVIDRDHPRFNQYGKVDKRGRSSQKTGGTITYVVIFGDERVEISGEKLKPTDTIQEVTVKKM